MVSYEAIKRFEDGCDDGVQRIQSRVPQIGAKIVQVNQRPHIARSGSNEHVTNLREPVAAEWAAQPDLLAHSVGETPNQFVEVFAQLSRNVLRSSNVIVT